MNLLLLSEDEVDEGGVATLTGRRMEHCQQVLKAAAGEVLRVGVRHGLVGTATVLSAERDALRLQVTLDAPPPPRANVDLLLAIPRPKQLKRILAAVASLGVDSVTLVNAARVEKSYFDSKVLAPDFVQGLFDLGLEQAKDTVPPRVSVKPRFKPFVEDELPALARAAAHRYVLHPVAAAPVRPHPVAERLLLAIGPDGGWVPFEVELLAKAGFVPVTLGPRTLRCEVAVPAILGALRQP